VNDKFYQFDYEGRRFWFLKNMPVRNNLAISFENGTFYELRVLESIRDEMGEGVVVDVGANVGNHTVYFSCCCPKATRVVAIEADSRLSSICSYNRIENSGVHVTVLGEKIIGAEPGWGWVKGGDPGNRFFGPDKDGPRRIHRLDDLGSSWGIGEDRISVLKVDVEGMDYDVLRGGRNRIVRDRPIVSVEVTHPAQNLDHRKEITELMEGLGYEVSKRFGRTWLFRSLS